MIKGGGLGEVTWVVFFCVEEKKHEKQSSRGTWHEWQIKRMKRKESAQTGSEGHERNEVTDRQSHNRVRGTEEHGQISKEKSIKRINRQTENESDRVR